VRSIYGYVQRGQRTLGASLFCIHGGKVTLLVNYLDRDRALTDLGLEG
jgi:hypothetical protein